MKVIEDRSASPASPPTVVGVDALASNRVRVTFSREMTNNVDLVDPTKYRFTKGLFATTVTRVDRDAVEVTTNEQVEGVTYELRVLP